MSGLDTVPHWTLSPKRLNAGTSNAKPQTLTAKSRRSCRDVGIPRGCRSKGPCLLLQGNSSTVLSLDLNPPEPKAPNPKPQTQENANLWLKQREASSRASVGGPGQQSRVECTQRKLLGLYTISTYFDLSNTVSFCVNSKSVFYICVGGESGFCRRSTVMLGCFNRF